MKIKIKTIHMCIFHIYIGDICIIVSKPLKDNSPLEGFGRFLVGFQNDNFQCHLFEFFYFLNVNFVKIIFFYFSPNIRKRKDILP